MHKKYYHIILTCVILISIVNVTHAQAIIKVDSSLNIQTNNLIVTDMNGDGLPDIAGVINSTSVVWYKNLGDSISRLPFSFVTADGVGMLRAADMDGDGDMDFVIGDYYGHYIDWLENLDGEGTLFTQHAISITWAGTGPRSIELCDINNDGTIDIVSNWGSANLLFYLNNGAVDPVFTQQLIPIGTSDPYFISVFDMDNDEDLDIVYYSKTLFQIIYRKNNSGIFDIAGVPLLDGGRVLSLKFTDMDLDGDHDMLIGYDYLAGTPAVKLYQNNAGAFTISQSWDYTHDVTGIITAKFNSDSLPDLMVLFNDYNLSYDDISLNEVAVFINTDALTFSSEIIPLLGIIPSNYNDIVTSALFGDFDLNGIDDIVLSDYHMLLVISASDTSEQIFTNYKEVFRPRSNVYAIKEVQLADSLLTTTILIDNQIDVYQYQQTADVITYQSTIEQVGINKNGYSHPYAAIVFDMDNDGFDDDLFTSGGIMYEGEDGVYQWNVYRNVTQNIPEKYSSSPNYSCITPVVADINADGYLDILASNGQLFYVGVDYDGFDIYEEFDAYYWLKNLGGSGNFEYKDLSDGYYHDEGNPVASDVDLDGDLDILVYNQTTDYLYCYYNTDGAGSFGDKIPLLTVTNGQYIKPHDVDGDGIEDILINTSGELIKWLQHIGPGTYLSPKVLCYTAKIRQPEKLMLADINNDGFKDLITGTYNTQIYLNTAGHGFYPYPIELPFNYVNRNITDLNHNGIFEIAGVYNTRYAYSRELEQMPAVPITQFTNYESSIDENQLLADTLFVALTAIPTDTLVYTVYPTSIDGSELEVQMFDGTLDSIQLIFLPDSTALLNQQIIIKAIDDDEVDEIENGRISYNINNTTNDFLLAATISRDYNIIDNDFIMPDNVSNLFINCNDTLLFEGTFGTACNLKLNLPIEYPVIITLFTDNQLDVGTGPQDSVTIIMPITDINTDFYIDAIADNITEGLHQGVLTIKTISEDDNFDQINTIVKMFSIDETIINNPEDTTQTETPKINVWYIPETQIISLQYNLYENDAIVTLLNNIGEAVAIIPLSSSTGETTLSTANLPEGYYYLMINSKSNHFTLGKTVVVY